MQEEVREEAPAKAEKPEKTEKSEKPKRERAERPERAERKSTERKEKPKRDYKRKDDDLILEPAPDNVKGFGNDIPAFLKR